MTRPSLPLIRCENVQKRHGHRRILRDVTFSVAAGEVLALLGENGSGKTTLLRIVAGLDRPDRGEVWLGPVPLSDGGHEIRRYVGVVAHAPLLYDRLTGLENLGFYARLYNLDDAEARIEHLLRSLRLWARRDDAVRTYSRGMSQRLAIARALLHDPPVIVFDEPDTGLDRQSLEGVSDLFSQLRGRGRAVFVTTHDTARAFCWADRVCELRNGCLQQIADSKRNGQ